MNEQDFDALILPGGFGAAKNLCTFAFHGNASVDAQVLTKIVALNAAKKPIGAICIAPTLIALSLGIQCPKITIGSHEETASVLEKLGAKHQNCATFDCVVDEDNKIITTPVYMDDSARLSDVFFWEYRS